MIALLLPLAFISASEEYRADRAELELRGLAGKWRFVDADDDDEDLELFIGFFDNESDMQRAERENHVILIDSIDTSTSPWRIEAVLATIGGAGGFHGICALEKGVLRICYKSNQKPGETEIPDEFRAVPNKQCLIVLRKVRR